MTCELSRIEPSCDNYTATQSVEQDGAGNSRTETMRLINCTWADPAATRAEQNRHPHLCPSRDIAHWRQDRASGNDEQPEDNTPSPAVAPGTLRNEQAEF